MSRSSHHCNWNYTDTICLTGDGKNEQQINLVYKKNTQTTPHNYGVLWILIYGGFKEELDLREAEREGTGWTVAKGEKEGHEMGRAEE